MYLVYAYFVDVHLVLSATVVRVASHFNGKLQNFI